MNSSTTRKPAQPNAFATIEAQPGMDKEAAMYDWFAMMAEWNARTPDPTPAACAAPSDDALLAADAAAHAAFLDAVDAAAPLETDPHDSDYDPPPSGGSQDASADEDDEDADPVCCWCAARPGTTKHLAGWFCSDECFDASAEVGRDLVLGRRSWIVSGDAAAADDELAAYEGWQSSADNR